MSIRLHNVCKSYAQGDSIIPVLTSVDLDVAGASICVIRGESGCGKTTLLSIIGALEYPDSGEIIVQEQPVHAMTEHEIDVFRRKTVSCIFQSHFLLKDFTATENLMLPLLLKGWNKADATLRAQEYLELVGLHHRTEHRPHALSGGECQRVAIARALITDARVILADEPTGNLDHDNAYAVITLLQNLVLEQKKTLFLVTHNREFFSLGDATYELAQGQLQSIAV